MANIFPRWLRPPEFGSSRTRAGWSVSSLKLSKKVAVSGGGVAVGVTITVVRASTRGFDRGERDARMRPGPCPLTIRLP